MSIKIPSVENFLFCLKLETGGLLLGWICGIGSVIVLTSSLLLFGLVVVNYPAFLNATTAVGDHENQVLQNLQFRKILFFEQNLQTFYKNL
jgi:hypothetical protein